MSFSAGIMAFGALAEILQKSRSAVADGGLAALLIPYSSFFGGIILMRVIERFVTDPAGGAPDTAAVSGEDAPDGERTEDRGGRAGCETGKTGGGHARMAVFTAVAIAIHNFPEGIATFISALDDRSTAFAVAFAVALHNIPEGIAAFMPVYYSTGSRKKAFLWSVFSGVAEPLGAVIGCFLLIPFMSGTVFSVMFGAVSGIMTYISFATLLPDALKAEDGLRVRPAVPGFITGMAVMAGSLILFGL